MRFSPGAKLITAVTPSELVFRVGRKPSAWKPPEWAYAGEDGTFGNRFDDPEKLYRVHYASAARFGCFLETLARFRKDPMLGVELTEIEGDDDFTILGTVPRAWLQSRIIGSARGVGRFADVYGSEWIAYLRLQLASQCVEHDIAELDASVLQHSAARGLTQRVSRIAYNLGFQGVRYVSKYAQDVENWAFFEPFSTLTPKAEWAIDPQDEEFVRALEVLGLQLEAGQKV